MRNENIQKFKVTRIYRELQNVSKNKDITVIVNVGGSGSSKTYSTLQFFITQRLLKHKNYKALFLRKIRQTNKLSIYKDFIEILQKHNLYDIRSHNRSDLIYSFFEKTEARFTGLDDRQQLKSTEWNDIVVEESNELEPEDLTFLKTRLYRGANVVIKPRIWLNLNPEECWIKNLEGKSDTHFIWSNYKDNPFCNEEYKKELEKLKEEDPIYYQIYALGKWGQRKHVIYEMPEMLKEYPERFNETIYGMDFGFNHPTVLLRIDIKDNCYYITELIHKSGLTNPQLLEEMKRVVPEDSRMDEMFGDSENPELIQEIYSAGFNIKGIIKNKNSVKNGIDYVKRRKIYTRPENINYNKQKRNYKWKTDKNGNVLDEPVKFDDDACDAERYGIYGYAQSLGITGMELEEMSEQSNEMPDIESSKADW